MCVKFFGDHNASCVPPSHVLPLDLALECGLHAPRVGGQSLAEKFRLGLKEILVYMTVSLQGRGGEGRGGGTRPGPAHARVGSADGPRREDQAGQDAALHDGELAGEEGLCAITGGGGRQ